jgi:hypothetical protein
MSFLNTNISATVAARLTKKGRNSIANGDFVISYFAVGDSEYNYSGGTQSVFAPFDKDVHVKYPFWYTTGSTFFGVPTKNAITTICSNVVAPNGDNAWTVNVVWDENPIGLNTTLSTYTSNKYTGVKNFLGYTKTSGQTYNTGTTIYDTMGSSVTISPEEQKTIAILHYSKSGTTLEPYKFFKYDDYISTGTSVTSGSGGLTDQQYFNVTIPSLIYHRVTGSTTFYMSTGATKTMVSKLNPRFTINYKDLVDYNNNRVGKIFINHKTVVFDDEEIVAVLDQGSNRVHTLPAPKVDVLVTNNDPINSFIEGKTLWVTYMLSGATETLPCNYYMKVTGSSYNEVVTVKFNSNEFKNLNNGYSASKFYILHQLKPNGVRPVSTDWNINKTAYNTDLNNNIDNLKTGHTFTINQTKFAAATSYTSTLSSFGAERDHPGGVSIVRSTDIEEMAFNINLPTGKFVLSQNPTYLTGDSKITEVALLNSNKETLVMGKLSAPITRSGNQVISVKIDF